MNRTRVTRVAAVALAAVAGFVVAGWVAAQDNATPKADAPEVQAAAPETKPAETKAPPAAEIKPTEPKAPAGPAVAWAADLAKAQEKAKAESKLVFMDFRADWCGPCKMLDQQTFTDAKVVAALNEMSPVQIDSDKNAETVDKFKVGPIPSLFVTTAEGEVLAHVVGFMPADKFLEFLDFAKAKQALAKDPKDAAAAVNAAMKSTSVEMDDAARGKLATAALELNSKAPDGVKSKLLLLRGQAAMADEKTQEAGTKDIEEARKLDPENANGVKELAEWIAIITAVQKTKDMPAFGAAAEKFLEAYPAAKIKDKMLHASVLNVVFRHRVSVGDLKGAIATLEALKADHKDIIDPERIDDVIQQVKLEIAKKDAGEAIKQPTPPEKPATPEEPKKIEEPKKVEEPVKPEEPKKAE